MMGLFGKTKSPDPKAQVQEWSRRIRKEGYCLDRQINGIKREELKVIKSIKDASKRGDNDTCRILAKEVVNARKTVSRLYTAKANLSSIEMQMKEQASQYRMTQCLRQSTEVMKNMQQLVKLPELQKTMMELSKEMTKAGIIEEMIEDTMDMNMEDELDEDIQKEVDKVLLDITAPKVAAGEASIKLPELPDEVKDVEEEEVEEDLEDMKERLEALKS